MKIIKPRVNGWHNLDKNATRQLKSVKTVGTNKTTYYHFPKIIDAGPIMKFIEDGLNGKHENKLLHFGHDAIEILTEIEYAPELEVEIVRHGKWVHSGMTNSSGPIYFCSVCKKPYNPNQADIDKKRIKENPEWCQNCGAKMDLESLEE